MQTEAALKLGPEGEFEKKRLTRLVKLQRSDAGFFLLASHSYIESWLRQKLHMWDEDHSFDDLIFKFKISLIENVKSFPRELSVLQVLRSKEKTALAVNHNFVEISNEEAAAAAYRLLQFCSLAKINNDAELGQIRSSLKLWEERRLIPDDELTILQQKLSMHITENKNICTEIEQLRKYRDESERYSRRIKHLEAEIKALTEQSGHSGIEKLVDEKNSAMQNKNSRAALIAKLSSADDYLSTLDRLTSYTRTRFDFERDVTRLTPEQTRVLELINLTDDFLIKGGAGTGKTLVLIKALEKALRYEKAELNFDNKGITVRMLTYNRTLAKYDRYLAEILQQEQDAARISTIDKFLYDKLKQINADYRIIFDDNYAEDLAADFNNTDFFDNRRLADEIEGYLFASDVKKDEYNNSDLTKAQREQVWNIRCSVIEKMKTNSAFSKNYSRIVILDYLSEQPEGNILKDTDFTFIDEVQDLSAVDIKAVKACTKRAVVMAGDSDQSIYQSGFTFTRAGIDIRGTTRILKTNFRNTTEIQSLTEKYRLLSSTADADNQPETFRTGPLPEFFQAADQNSLISMMIKRVKLFTNELNYDPENICILVPSGSDIEPLQSALKETCYDGRDLRTDDFSFNEHNIIRISTMHSSKGLDFPVVLLYLHKLPKTPMKRNLIYVSMTRAMDQLNIFTLENETSPEITDLTTLQH